jgi:hypothetical protein
MGQQSAFVQLGHPTPRLPSSSEAATKQQLQTTAEALESHSYKPATANSNHNRTSNPYKQFKKSYMQSRPFETLKVIEAEKYGNVITAWNRRVKV